MLAIIPISYSSSFALSFFLSLARLKAIHSGWSFRIKKAEKQIVLSIAKRERFQSPHSYTQSVSRLPEKQEKHHIRIYSLVRKSSARRASGSRVFRHMPKFYDQLPSGGSKKKKKKKLVRVEGFLVPPSCARRGADGVPPALAGCNFSDSVCFFLVLE
jgi:hypothetical protein